MGLVLMALRSRVRDALWAEPASRRSALSNANLKGGKGWYSTVFLILLSRHQVPPLVISLGFGFLGLFPFLSRVSVPVASPFLYFILMDFQLKMANVSCS